MQQIKCSKRYFSFNLQPQANILGSLGFRFADESSSVIHAGLTPPDDGSSMGMSASEFIVSSPTRACQVECAKTRKFLKPNPSSKIGFWAKKPRSKYEHNPNLT